MTSEKTFTSGVKNLLNEFEEAGEEHLEHMPDYEQFVSGIDIKIENFWNSINKNLMLIWCHVYCSADDDDEANDGHCKTYY